MTLVRISQRLKSFGWQLTAMFRMLTSKGVKLLQVHTMPTVKTIINRSKSNRLVLNSCVPKIELFIPHDLVADSAGLDAWPGSAPVPGQGRRGGSEARGEREGASR